jgi:hypothetical protein
LARRELKSTNPEHDLQLARIFDKLSQAIGLVEIKTENELQSVIFGNNDHEYEPFRRLNSDIFFSFLIKGKEYKVAVEYERTRKESNRWSQYLYNYHFEESVDLVLYICDNQYIKNGLIKLETELAKKYSGKIFFCNLDEFNSNEEMARFINTIGKTVTINFPPKELTEKHTKQVSKKNVTGCIN